MENITLCKTKAGKGFKLCIDGTWLYTSKTELFRVLNNKANACQFRTIDKPAEGSSIEELKAEKLVEDPASFSSFSDT